VVSHVVIVSAALGLKWVLYDDLSKKERNSEFDDAEAAVLPSQLADDPTFLRKAEAVAAAPVAKRRSVALREAADYREYRSPARDFIAGCLIEAAEARWRQKAQYVDRLDAALRRTHFANLPRRAVWAEAPLEGTDPVRIRRREPALQEGAARVLRRGAGQCVACGVTLSERYICVGGSRRRTRRERCSACVELRDTYPTAIRDVLEAATRMRQRRREARRA
jgi:hypothetical protein